MKSRCVPGVEGRAGSHEGQGYEHRNRKVEVWLVPALDKQERAGLGKPSSGLRAARGEMVMYDYCLHGYVRGVCGVCTDPGHNCQAPRLKKQVARLKAERDALRAQVAGVKNVLLYAMPTHDGCVGVSCPCMPGRALALTEKEIQRALRKEGA